MALRRVGIRHGHRRGPSSSASSGHTHPDRTRRSSRDSQYRPTSTSNPQHLRAGGIHEEWRRIVAQAQVAASLHPTEPTSSTDFVDDLAARIRHLTFDGDLECVAHEDVTGLQQAAPREQRHAGRSSPRCRPADTCEPSDPARGARRFPRRPRQDFVSRESMEHA